MQGRPSYSIALEFNNVLYSLHQYQHVHTFMVQRGLAAEGWAEEDEGHEVAVDLWHLMHWMRTSARLVCTQLAALSTQL